MRFDCPVGGQADRDDMKIWPGFWVDATGYATWYNATGAWCYHTGVDLNLNSPAWDADAHSPVYAASDGKVVFAGDLAGWGAVVVAAHPAGIDTPAVWSRYGHVEKILVAVGDTVARGQQLASIGNAYGRYPFHLHFDLASVDLGASPGDWPGADLDRLKRTYFDPKEFIQQHHAPVTQSSAIGMCKVTANPWVRIRSEARGNAPVLGGLFTGDVVPVIRIDNGWAKVPLQVGQTPIKADGLPKHEVFGYVYAPFLQPI